MDIREGATFIVKKLVQEGFIAYFAGGWVRDYIMGHPSSDIDIATNAPPEKIVELFPRTIQVGMAFGVVVVVLEGHQYEVSTFRRDINYVNGRSPERIELSTPEEDAIRRDFTINGMFYDPLKDEIHDYVKGREDIQNAIIRTIGNPHERFFEDRLRMIRAFRFSSRFGFPIATETQQAILANAKTLFPAVAIERIWQEFTKMAAYPNFDKALIEMHRLELLPVIFPQLKEISLTEIKNNVKYFDKMKKGSPTILYLLDLFPNASLDELNELSKYLKVSNQEVKLLEFLHQNKNLLSRGGSDMDWVSFYGHANSSIALDFSAAHTENLQEFIQIHDERRARLASHIERVITRKPLVDAALLIKKGVAPGKEMGVLLKEAENIAILYNLNDPSQVLEHLSKSKNWVIK